MCLSWPPLAALSTFLKTRKLKQSEKGNTDLDECDFDDDEDEPVIEDDAEDDTREDK